MNIYKQIYLYTRGEFCKGINCIISLDNLSSKIDIYDLDCKYKKSIKPNGIEDIRKKSEVIIFNFAWSEK